MQTPERHLAPDLVCAALSLGLAALLMLANTSRAESPASESDSVTPVLLAFQADWCGACRQMNPTVDALARDGYSVERINVDQDRNLAARFNVDAIPCFVVIERGREVDRIVGHADIERLKLKLRRPSAVDSRQSAGKNTESAERRPHPAWRYEKPVGYRAAVVRVFCQDDSRTRSIGSGTLVRWATQKLVVLTARHVIQDAKQITVELFNKKTYKARVLKVDAVWDCAVLELHGTPDGVEPADLELGDDAMQQQGNRLESCGYGPDGRLACNSGLFLGYKRSTQAPNGPDDWFEISGHARQGDSGGGVFNPKGRLVGVLWGTNGQVVVAVQAGRLHVLLDAAIAQGTVPIFAPAKMGLSPSTQPIAQQSYRPLQYLQRKPTPPKPRMSLADLPKADDLPSPVAGEGPGVRAGENAVASFATAPACQGNQCCPLPGPEPSEPEATAAKKPNAVLPWRGEAQARDSKLDARTRDLLQAIEAERRARLAAQQPPAPEPAKPEPKKEEPSPLIAGLAVLAAILVGFVVYFASTKNQ